jgi:hypothetical protein
MWRSDQASDTSVEQNSPSRRSIHVLLWTQAIFFAAIAWCLYLEHGFSARSAGISYYGVNHRTIVIAIAGYVVAAVGLWRTSRLFREGHLDPLLSLGLKVVAVMLLRLLATPYNQGTFLNWTHMSVGVLGALVQLAMSIALLRRYGSARAIVGFSVQLAGGIIGALSLPDWRFQILLYGEILYEIGFSLCLLEWAKHMDPLITS